MLRRRAAEAAARGLRSLLPDSCRRATLDSPVPSTSIGSSSRLGWRHYMSVVVRGGSKSFAGDAALAPSAPQQGPAVAGWRSSAWRQQLRQQWTDRGCVVCCFSLTRCLCC
jgi:hypothetical protein